ncbi:MAG: peptidylprolyl isomerase [Paracoccaceae bacterium]
MAPAQGLFSPAFIIDADAVTYYELEQRIRFMEVLNLPGNAEEVAAEELINDRLKQQVLRDVGIEVSAEAIEEAMNGFAQRANLSRQEFIQALAQEGVDFETFRDFVKINLEWRDFISGQFLGQARPSEQEIDRALSTQGSGGVRVLLSEIVIPITPQNFEAVEAEAARLSQIRSFDEFSQEAARLSATDSRQQGGRLDWMPITNLPPALRPVILDLAPGEVTSPLNIPNAVALFQMRDIQETVPPAPRYSEIEYAIYYLAGGRSAETLAYAESLRNRMDRCDDLYGENLGRPAEYLFRESQAPSQIPRNVALELAKLDEGEVSTSLTTQDGRLMFIMLCGRDPVASDEEAREQVAIALTQQRLNDLSESLVAQLRANAHIIQK